MEYISLYLIQEEQFYNKSGFEKKCIQKALLRPLHSMEMVVLAKVKQNVIVLHVINALFINSFIFFVKLFFRKKLFR